MQANRDSQANKTVKVVIASDHAGYDQKCQLLDYLVSCSFSVIDLGPSDASSVDYPDFAAKVAQAVSDAASRGEALYGVLICGTGIGMAIAANKYPGVRAANVVSAEFASLAREHNDINIVTLSARFVDLNSNKKILDAVFATAFGGGRHAQRLQKITQIEQQLQEDNTMFISC